MDVWQGSECASELASKVTVVSFLKQFEISKVNDNLLAKTKKKEPAELLIS